MVTYNHCKTLDQLGQKDATVKTNQSTFTNKEK